VDGVAKAKHVMELEVLTDGVATALSQLEQLKELVNSGTAFDSDAIAAKLHKVAHKLGTASMNSAAVAWYVNGRN
jgi:hypothetical protein